MTTTTPTFIPEAMSPPMTATYSSPSRNMTNSMRAAQARVAGVAPPRYSSGYQALVGEQLPHLVERGVGAGKDELRRARCSRRPPASRRHGPC